MLISKKTFVLAGVGLLLPVLAFAQAPPAEPEAPAAPAAPRAPGKPAKPATPGTPAPAVAPAPPEPPARIAKGEAVNVRVDLRLRTQSGSSTTSERTLSVVAVGDGSKTAVRSGSDVPIPTGAGGAFQYRNVGLTADVRVIVEKRVQLSLTLSYNYLATTPAADKPVTIGSMTSEIRALLEDGKPLVISDQVDAATDQRLIVEAKATILR